MRSILALLLLVVASLMMTACATARTTAPADFTAIAGMPSHKAKYYAD